MSLKSIWEEKTRYWEDWGKMRMRSHNLITQYWISAKIDWNRLFRNNIFVPLEKLIINEFDLMLSWKTPTFNAHWWSKTATIASGIEVHWVIQIFIGCNPLRISRAIPLTLSIFLKPKLLCHVLKRMAIMNSIPYQSFFFLIILKISPLVFLLNYIL